MKPSKSFNDYMNSKLRKACKEYYFRNDLHLDKTKKNPVQMNDKELGVFIDKNLLHFTFFEVFNDTAYKFFIIDLKFKKSEMPKEVLEVLEVLYAESKNSYLVGGCTRDIILGKTVKDYDFATDIPYERLKEIFKDYKFKETGTEFLVFNLNYKGVDYEIANFRKDSKESDGRRPNSVKVGTLQEDAERRDFTVNNIYWNTEELYILEESVDDILDKVIRFVGNPDERLKEDLLRGLRFYRLLKSKELTPDKESLKAVRRNWDKVIGSNPTRVMLEIEKMAGII